MDNRESCHIGNRFFTLSQCERLAKRNEIGRLFTYGEAFLVYPVKCTYLFRGLVDQQSDGDRVEVMCNRVMVMAPKRNHKRAVVRNLLKRRIREAYRLHKQLLGVSPSDVNSSGEDGRQEWVDVALSYVGKGEPHDYHHIERAVIDILNRLCKISDQKKVFRNSVEQ